MRTLLNLLAVITVMSLAFWAYRENYATQAALKEMRALKREIGELREAIGVQRAEWAYLNRPDRLTDLVTTNFDRLGLLPMAAEQFATTRQLPMPLPPGPEIDLPPLGGTVDTSGTLGTAP